MVWKKWRKILEVSEKCLMEKNRNIQSYESQYNFLNILTFFVQNFGILDPLTEKIATVEQMDEFKTCAIVKERL